MTPGQAIGDTDERRELQSLFVRFSDQFLKHLGQTLYRLLAACLIVCMAPDLGFPYACLGQIRRFLTTRFDDPAADVGATKVDRENAVVPLEDPGRNEMQRTDQARVIGLVADRQHVDLEVLVLENYFSACDGQFAEPAITKATAHHDALGFSHALVLRKRRVT